jgi:hypothetical protein
MLGTLLFPCMALLFVLVAMTRPGANRLFRGRYRREVDDQPRPTDTRSDRRHPRSGASPLIP